MKRVFKPSNTLLQRGQVRSTSACQEGCKACKNPRKISFFSFNSFASTHELALVNFVAYPNSFECLKQAITHMVYSQIQWQTQCADECFSLLIAFLPARPSSILTENVSDLNFKVLYLLLKRDRGFDQYFGPNTSQPNSRS